MKYTYIMLILMELSIAFGCKNRESRKFNIEIEKVSEILLSEKDVVIGNIFQCIATNDSQIVILDIEASDIKQYDFRGNYVRTLVKRGSSPNEVLAPRGIGLNDKYLFVADFATNSTKVFSINGEYINQIFPEGYNIVMGSIKILPDGRVLHGASSDTRGYYFATVIIDTTGKLIAKGAKYPKVYQEYKRLIGIYYCDANAFGEYVICFAKSPDIFIGNSKDNNGSFKEFDENNKKKYVSDKRSKEGDNALQVEYEEFFNLGIFYLSDTLILRPYGKTTPEAEKSKSFLLFSDKKIDILNREGEIISTISVQGRLLCTFKNYLVLEENDAPNNRIIAFYKLSMKEN